MKTLLSQLVRGETLSRQQTADAFETMMTGQMEPPQIAAMLAMMQQRGPTVDELTGAASVMRAKVTPVTVPDGLIAIDTCGTGGDHSGTFNISTAAAIVAAGAGRPHNLVVAKHGNRSVTSKSGSSQVLETLGVKLQVKTQTLTHCLDQAGMCFCFAQAHHPAMKYAMPVRQALGFPTLFNLLGPLTNPAGAARQVLGVFSPQLTEKLAQVLANLGAEHAMVVHGQGMDELITWDTTQISIVQNGKVQTITLNPTEIDLDPAAHHTTPNDLQANGPKASATIITQILDGQQGPAREIVCLNAAAALVVGEVAQDLNHGLTLARQAIDSKAARKALDQLVAITQADSTPSP